MKKKLALIFAAAMVLSAVPVASISAERPMNPLIATNPTIAANPNALKVNKEYYFKNVYSGKYLEAISGDKHSQLKQNDFTGSANQKFKFTTASNGSYSLVPLVNTELKCDISGASSKNGTKLQLFKDNPSFINAQTFKVVSNGDGTYRIITNISKTEKVVEVAGPSKKAGAKVQIWNYVGAKNQKWTLEEVDAPKPEEEKEPEHIVADYVSLSLKNDLKEDNLMAYIKVTNNSDSDITTTDEVELEKMSSDGRWRRISNYNMSLDHNKYVISAKSVFPMAFDVQEYSNEGINTGKYRATKEFTVDGKTFEKSFEFYVENGTGSVGNVVKLSSKAFNKDVRFVSGKFYLYKGNTTYSNTESTNLKLMESVKKINDVNVTIVDNNDWNSIVKDQKPENKLVFRNNEGKDVEITLYGDIANIGYLTLSDGTSTYKLAADKDQYNIVKKIAYDGLHMSMPR